MKRKLAVLSVLTGGIVVLLASPAIAQEAEAPDPTQVVLDNLWVFIAGVLVFLMQAGFGLVEAGLTQSKNVANIMAKNLADMVIGVLAFFAVGYAFAFGSGNDLFGTEFFLLDGAGLFENSGVGNLTHATLFFFQVVFAATAVTIASGAMAERTKFVSYLIFAALMTGIIYPVVVHWTWGGGLIAQLSVGDAVYSDFAGSTVVHSTGGWAALMGALVLGPRLGKYARDGRPRAIPGHNIVFTVIGAFILWFGWFGFNAGSELAADDFVPFVAVNTLLAACAGAAGATIAIWSKSGKPDVAMIANGVLAGLVSITAGTGTMTPAFALVTGFIGGLIVVGAVLFFDRIRIDDPVGAISVHGICGVWGTLAIGLFARYDDAFLGRENAGLFYGGGVDQLAVQALMVVIVAAWVIPTSGLVFYGLKSTIGLRVSEEEEMGGLDVMEHGTPGYHLPAPAAAMSIDIGEHEESVAPAEKSPAPVLQPSHGTA
ncbi:MAG: ammonium transporter [Acidimicrobiales bacterium]